MRQLLCVPIHLKSSVESLLEVFGVLLVEEVTVFDFLTKVELVGEDVSFLPRSSME